MKKRLICVAIVAGFVLSIGMLVGVRHFILDKHHPTVKVKTVQTYEDWTEKLYERFEVSEVYATPAYTERDKVRAYALCRKEADEREVVIGYLVEDPDVDTEWDFLLEP